MSEASNTPKKRCSVEGCENTLKARGWCPMHYQRWWKYGDVGPAHRIDLHVTQHGTNNEYANYGCRCAACRAAASQYQAQRKRTVPCSVCGKVIWRHNKSGKCTSCVQLIPIEERHGTETGYSKGCRCSACRGAAAEARRRRRAANPEHEREYQRTYQRRRYWKSLTPMQRATSRLAKEIAV